MIGNHIVTVRSKADAVQQKHRLTKQENKQQKDDTANVRYTQSVLRLEGSWSVVGRIYGTGGFSAGSGTASRGEITQ